MKDVLHRLDKTKNKNAVVSLTTNMKCAITFVFVGAAVGVALGAAALKSEKSVPHIIGGDSVDYLDQPYTIRLNLTKNGEFVRYCGGSRLDPYWFVTAAECLEKEKYDHIQILYPADQDDVDQKNYQTKDFDFNQVKVVIHPQYSNVTKVNNIALFRCGWESCSPKPDFENLPQLPYEGEVNQTFSGLPAVVAGWTITNLTASDQIMSFDTHVVNPFVCKLLYFLRVNSSYVCASSWGGKRLSKGHVGVPLVINGPNEHSALKLVGIASHIQPWTTWLPIPTVFLKIAPYVAWIRKTTEIIKSDQF